MNPWDKNAAARDRQIRSGLDLSYHHILVPAILSSLPRPDGRRWKKILDAGCGSGFLLQELDRLGWRVTGADSSQRMLEIASRNLGSDSPVELVYSEIEDLPSVAAPDFDAVVVNMSLSGQWEIGNSLRSLSELTRDRGLLVLADVHPWFWRNYKGRFDLSYWDTERLIEPFVISLDKVPLPEPTPVVYRPLHELVTAIVDAGYLLEAIHEPRPDPETEARYPQRWPYPRFIVLVGRRVVNP